jgi:Kdo2-lipid A phosphotransferase
LVLCQCLWALLLLTFFSPWTAPLWKKWDLAAFEFFNSPLRWGQGMRLFWAMANHSLADWFEDLCILTFYVVAVWKTEKHLRLKKSAGFIFCLLLTAATILLVNRLVCRDLLRLRRTSPSISVPKALYLPDYLPDTTVKVHSSKSFPGDHAATALMFALSYAYIVKGRLALFALAYGAFLCLPRLVVGAHWFSDLIVGSGTIVLFSLSWAFFTPLADRCTAWIQTGIKKLRLKT